MKEIHWKLLSMLLIGLILGFGASEGANYLKNRNNTATNNPTAAQPTTQNPTQPAPVVQVTVDDDAVLGNPDAKLTVIEFSDFQCPFCSDFYTETLPLIKKAYIDTGKIKLVYRDLPLSDKHPQSQKAAEAAECAGEQDKYFEMHDLLFENQSTWSGNNTEAANTKAMKLFKEFAKQLKLTTTDFNSCLDSGKMADEVVKDLQDAYISEIYGTPTFSINGRIIKGAQQFPYFQNIIEQELAKN